MRKTCPVCNIAFDPEYIQWRNPLAGQPNSMCVVAPIFVQDAHTSVKKP
jgi:hypothetical protein